MTRSKKGILLKEGPSIPALTRRLQELPADFQALPIDQAGNGLVSVSALVFDLILDFHIRPLPVPNELKEFVLPQKASKQDLNRLKMVMASIWLLYDPWFRGRNDLADKLLPLMQSGLSKFALVVKASELASDPDRREELARLCLSELGLFPAGETPAQAQDRLTALDSAERDKVMQASRAAILVSQEAKRKRRIEAEVERKRREAEAAATNGRE